MTEYLDMSPPLVGPGTRVVLSVIEPWELGDRPHAATIIGMDFGPDNACRRATIRLVDPVAFGGETYAFFVMVPRARGASVGDLSKRPVDCFVTNADPRRPETLDPVNWRGGLAILATVAVKKDDA